MRGPRELGVGEELEVAAAARRWGRGRRGAMGGSELARVWAAGQGMSFSFFSIDRWMEGCGMKRWMDGWMDGRHVIDPWEGF